MGDLNGSYDAWGPDFAYIPFQNLLLSLHLSKPTAHFLTFP